MTLGDHFIQTAQRLAKEADSLSRYETLSRNTEAITRLRIEAARDMDTGSNSR